MRHPSREWKFILPVIVLTIVLAGADLWYFNSQAGPAGDPAAVSAAGDCFFDPEKKPFPNHQALVTVSDPYAGTYDAPVTVIEFFDPNCPHCKNLYPTMKQVVAQYGDRARFVFKPIALPGWDHSVPQVLAMYAAAKEGKFMLMMEEQMERQQPRTGLSLEQLKEIAAEIGMDPEAMAEQVQRGEGREYLLSQRQMAGQIGVTGVPAVLINGKFVDGRSRTVECLGALIEQEAARAP
ncbi:MAG: hypothetical protein D6685_04945 [Bacteroidetes bacterium]|nr:hypothetical protein AWN76_006035 [Rhodothermaceae bacterium RA]RMH66402.1 MAG: hypothetical protein D6685_04945 [Bacteroidota bacterium]